MNTLRHTPLKLVRLSWAAILVIALFCVAASAVRCQDRPEIADVRLSPDSERLVIKTRGSTLHPEALALRSPARLVLDFKGARPADSAYSIKDIGGYIRGITVRSAPTGARVEVEFSDDRVPDYRIRQLGSSVLVFFSWDAQAEARRAGRGEASVANSTASVEAGVSSDKAVWKPAPAGKGKTGLFIKRADVEDGLIVLDVADGKHPDATYRISLGVDLERRGFRSASVRKLATSAQLRESSSDRWSAVAGASSRRERTKEASVDGPRPLRGTSGRVK
jgi:hypothetical protein